MKPFELRGLIKQGIFKRATSGVCPGYVQANLVVLDEKYAEDFEKFCYLNSKAIPLLETIKRGHKSSFLAKDADLLDEIPMYNVFKNGKVVKCVDNIKEYYRKDLVFFLIGCSFSFENALIKEGISLRHVENCQNVSMYDTAIELKSSGVFKGKMVVSMRPIKREFVDKVYEITSHFPKMHGMPIYHGDPLKIGIKDINSPDYGDKVEIKEDEVPVFWPCGVTPQNVLREVGLSFAVTHKPGYMFVSDKKDEEFYE